MTSAKGSIWPATASARGCLTDPADDPARLGAEPLRPLLAVRRTLAFAGRSSRSELIAYLFASLLVSVPVSFVTGLLLPHDQHRLIMNGLTVLLAVPLPALLVRRLHDSGRSGSAPSRAGSSAGSVKQPRALAVAGQIEPFALVILAHPHRDHQTDQYG